MSGVEVQNFKSQKKYKIEWITDLEWSRGHGKVWMRKISIMEPLNMVDVSNLAWIAAALIMIKDTSYKKQAEPF